MPARSRGAQRPNGAAPGRRPPPAHRRRRTGYLFFNAPEAAFIEAAVARLIPPDEIGPGALEAGVPNYIDKQLGGAWGAGERLYRSGPWQPGTPQQGYQLPFTPAELFRTALRAINDGPGAARNTPFAQAAGARAGRVSRRSCRPASKDLDGVPSNVFFESLLAMTDRRLLQRPGVWRQQGHGGRGR